MGMGFPRDGTVDTLFHVSHRW